MTPAESPYAGVNSIGRSGRNHAASRKALITGHERGSQFSAGRILRPLRRCHYAAETFTLQGLI
jgi:hypothetical protein